MMLCGFPKTHNTFPIFERLRDSSIPKYISLGDIIANDIKVKMESLR